MSGGGDCISELKALASSPGYGRRLVSIGGGRRRAFSIDSCSVRCVCLVVSIEGFGCRKCKEDFDGGEDGEASDETLGSPVVLGSIVGVQ